MTLQQTIYKLSDFFWILLVAWMAKNSVCLLLKRAKHTYRLNFHCKIAFKLNCEWWSESFLASFCLVQSIRHIFGVHLRRHWIITERLQRNLLCTFLPLAWVRGDGWLWRSVEGRPRRERSGWEVIQETIPYCCSDTRCSSWASPLSLSIHLPHVRSWSLPRMAGSFWILYSW